MCLRKNAKIGKEIKASFKNGKRYFWRVVQTQHTKQRFYAPFKGYPVNVGWYVSSRRDKVLTSRENRYGDIELGIHVYNTEATANAAAKWLRRNRNGNKHALSFINGCGKNGYKVIRVIGYESDFVVGGQDEVTKDAAAVFMKIFIPWQSLAGK